MANLEILIERLEAAASKDDPDGLANACRELTDQLPREPDTIEAGLAHRALCSLRNNRRFDRMTHLAEAFIADGCEDAQVQRQYAQSLIENGQLTPAIRILEGVISDRNAPKAERDDAKGVLGRAWKERALAARGARDATAANALKKAYKSYMGVYAKNPKALYQGINAVALAAWDRGLALKTSNRDAAGPIAEDILSRVRKKAKAKRKPWEMAIAGEALIALGRAEEAVDWFRDYAHEADAFALAGTIRQLTDLWELDDTDEGVNLLAPMRAHLLEKPGGQFAIRKDDIHHMAAVDKAAYEKVLGDIGPLTYRFMQRGLKAAESVALIRQNGRGMGTGFLVRAKDIGYGDDDELLVLTNAHVVSNPTVDDAAHPEEVTVSFEIAPDQEEYEVIEVVWQSDPDRHDASVLRLGTDLRGKMKPLKFSSNLPALNTTKKQRVYIIGHPGGGEISFSFQDNELLDYETGTGGKPDGSKACRIHYRTPTEPGSSGSPVFNGNWSTIALHHAGSKRMHRLNGDSGTYPANEGIWIQSIRNAIASL